MSNPKLTGFLSGVSRLSGGLSGAQTLTGGLSIPRSVTADIPPATTSTLGGIIVGEDLQITEQGVLSVVKANAVEHDNTHPITAAAVYVEVGNINALLATI